MTASFDILKDEVQSLRTSNGFPNRKQDEWNYVNTDFLKQFSEHGSEGIKQDVDVSSFLSKESNSYVSISSPSKGDIKLNNADDWECTPFQEMNDGGQQKLIAQIKRSCSNDYFSQLNVERTLEHSVTLSLPAGKRPKDVLQVFMPGSSQCSRLHIHIERSSEASVILQSVGIGDSELFNNMEVSIQLEKGARLNLVLLQKESSETVHMSGFHVQQERDSYFKLVDLVRATKFTRHRVQVELEGENAEVQLCGMAALEGEQRQHHWIQINHHVPHCRSRQLFKHILKDKSRASFDGTVYVEKHAFKTEAHQLNNNLVLSEDARASVKPRLKIYNDDVVCTHGATVGQLEQDELFYLQTRGLSEAKAKNMLAYGFLREIVEESPFKVLAEEWDKEVLKKLFPMEG